MKNYKLHTSEGYKDTFGLEMLIKKEIEHRILNEFKHFGYELIKTPTVEYIDVYSSNGMQKPDLYSLINRQGEVLALCNDMTSSIARYVCSNHLDGQLKYCYTADVFRYPRLYQGKKHQFLQGGIELIGSAGLESDLEPIFLAYKCLKACGVKDFTIHIGSAQFFNMLLADFDISNELKALINESIRDKDYVTLNNVLHSSLEKNKADFIVDLMLRGGKLKYIDNLIDELKGKKSCAELCYLKEIYLTLKDLGVENIIFDFSIYSYAGYYTGLVFAVYINGISKAVIEGGRCDDLFKTFGTDLKNIGFGLDVDALSLYVLENNLMDLENKKYLAYCCDKESFGLACKNNNELRNMGIIVNHLSFTTFDEALYYAKLHGYEMVLEYKNNTLNSKEVE